MDKTETSLMQKTPSRPEGEEAGNERREDLDVLLPFCFVTIWPKDAKPKYLIKEAVKLFEKRDQRHLQLSQKIREKVLKRGRVIGRLENLKYMLRKLNLELDKMANGKRTPIEEDVDSHGVYDELTEMRKEEKPTLEAIIQDTEKEFEAIKEEIWSHMDHLKEKHHRNEASVCILDLKKIRGKYRWFFISWCLECTHSWGTSMDKSSITL